MTLDLSYEPRGRLTPDFDLSRLTWLRVGGPADWLFMPKDEEDLCGFLAALPEGIEIFPMGVGSNLIVRDGGVRAVVIRLGPAFAGVEIEGDLVRAGAGTLDKRVAIAAAEAGRDLTFLRTIPGAIGGAVRMNAGCYGSYVADHLVSARAVSRACEVAELAADDLRFEYRNSHLPDGWVLTEATFRAEEGDPNVLMAKMEAQLAKRAESQPVDELTAGSTFRNPAGYSSTGQADDTHEEKAWKVIDEAGMRGATMGGAQMSEMHPNFLINTGDATAADLEGLGEEVRERVRAHSGHELTWEVKRIGEPG